MLKTAFTTETIKKATPKIALAKTYKLLGNKMGNFHTSPETACSFYLNLEHDFNGEKAPLMLVGKMGKWKNVVKKTVAEDPTKTLRGAAYLRMSEDGVTPEALMLMPVKGKAKETPITKAFKPLTKKLGVEIIIGKAMSEEEFEALEAKEDQIADTEEEELDDTAELEALADYDETQLLAAYQTLRKHVQAAAPHYKKQPVTSAIVGLMKNVQEGSAAFQQVLATAPDSEKNKYAAFLKEIKPLADYAEQLVKAFGANAKESKPFDAKALSEAYQSLNEKAKIADVFQKKKLLNAQALEAYQAVVTAGETFDRALQSAPESEKAKYQAFIKGVGTVRSLAAQGLAAAPSERNDLAKAAERNRELMKEITTLVQELNAVLAAAK